MDHAGVYETLLRDPAISKQLGAFLWGYGPDDIDTDVHPREHSRSAKGIEFLITSKLVRPVYHHD